MEFKRRKKKKEHEWDQIQPTKEETAVAKHLRWSCPTKSSTMMGNKVEYFVASKAVECLLDSNWASGKKNTEILFTTRESAVDYLDRLLALGFFSRVVKIKKVKGKDKGKDKDKADDDDTKKKKKEKKEKVDDPSKDDNAEAQGQTEKDDNAEGQEQPDKDSEKSSGVSGAPGTASGTTTTTTEEGKKKRKVKVKLELHEDQIFLDGDDAYVWIYDPVHPKTLFMGILVVIGSIAICLFPLWPDSVREGVWYISVFAAVAIGIILFLAVFRYVLFAIVWASTRGRHHFWLLPNLTEECGFLESFQPLYTHELITKPTNTKPARQIPDEDRDELMDDDDYQRNEDKDTGSDDKDDKDVDKDAWVKLTKEEVEKAKKEAKMDEYQVKPEELDGNSETTDDRNTTTSDPVC